MPQRITPFLWFDNQAEEAANFYVSIFQNSEVIEVNRAPAGGPIPEGTVFTVTFKLNGQTFYALNGGPEFKFTEAISFFIECDSQEEVDHLWDALTAGGEPSQCGWLKDKFGLSWQVVPTALGRLMGDPDREKATRVMQAMLQMQKLDVAKLEAAYAGT